MKWLKNFIEAIKWALRDKCPVCRSVNIYMGKEKIKDNAYVRKCSCRRCKHKWEDIRPYPDFQFSEVNKI